MQECSGGGGGGGALDAGASAKQCFTDGIHFVTFRDAHVMR